MVLAFSLLGNGLFVALVLWGWWAGRHNIGARLYVLPNRVRRPSFFACYPVQEGDVVLLGDSLTAGAQWSEMFPGAPVKNRGIGGDTTAAVLDRLGQVTAGRPARVLLMVGTNDLSLGVPEERIVANYAAILDRLSSKVAQGRGVLKRHRSSPPPETIDLPLPRFRQGRIVFKGDSVRMEPIALGLAPGPLMPFSAVKRRSRIVEARWPETRSNPASVSPEAEMIERFGRPQWGDVGGSSVAVSPYNGYRRHKGGAFN